jgi:hypothetical protein
MAVADERAASMNSIFFSVMTWPRTMRAIVSHSTAPMATKSRMMFRPKNTMSRMTKDGERQRVDDVHEAHHDGVGLAADVARDRAVATPMVSATRVAQRPTPIEMRPP